MPAKKVSLSNAESGSKPSLSSLKIKGDNSAAKKRAVKKIEAAMSKKVGTIKITKKTGEKKVVIKRATKKAPAISRPLTDSDPVLLLPSNISIRAREKALVILHSVVKDFDKSAQQVAYVSGLCFILLGASMSLAFTNPFSKNIPQQAQLSSSSLSTMTTGSPGAAYQVSSVAEPTFTLIDQLPAEVTGATRHKLDIQNALDIDVEAISQTGRKVGLKVDTLQNGKYEFVLDAKDLDPGSYRVKLIITGLSQVKFYRSLSQFVVPVSTTPPVEDGEEGDEAAGDGAASQDEENSDVEEEEVDSENESDIASSTDESVDETVPKITLSVPSKTIKGRLALIVNGPDNIEPPRLFVRALNTIQQQPKGEAEFRDGKWFFFFNTENLPNGEYELVAKSSFGGEALKTPAVRVKVANFVIPQNIAQPETAVAAPTTPEIQTAPGVSSTERGTGSSVPGALPNKPVAEEGTIGNGSIRTFSEFTIDEVSGASSTKPINKEVKAEVDGLFGKYQSDLKDLFKRYAIAQQSGDPIMLEIARKELESGKDRIIKEVLNNDSINHLADNIDDELDSRFGTLQKRVETFEELRKTATNNESSSDKDSDGISDYDEEFLFGTDPEQADSDNDGVTDGVEVMKGFNPVNPAAEAVIEYEMPEESLGLVEEEVLQVHTVAPVVRGDLDEETPPIQAEIRGKGLPNSFVTLYIFSTPTVVTVRTDQDGSFVYTFEKELEDGKHDVYVAITDNTGAIVARSNPFSFVKEAQAFTPVTEQAAEVVTTDVPPAQRSLTMYNIIVGLGILALGLILLMLGVGMREREKMINPVPFDAPKTS